jgi:hypothetical protein
MKEEAMTKESEQSDVKVAKRKYSNFEIKLQTGSRRKQKLSNKLSIKVSDSSANSEISLSLRDAKVLREFLNSHLS